MKVFKKRELILLVSVMAAVDLVVADDKTVVNDDWQISASLQSFVYSEAVSIETMLNEWRGPFLGGETAFSHNRLTLGASWENFSVSLLRRDDYLLEFSQDTALYYHSDQNDTLLARDRNFDIYLDVTNIRSRGIGFDYRWIFGEKLTIGVGVSLLDAFWLTDGNITGQISIDANDDVSGLLHLDYYYSEDSILDRQIAVLPQGRGFATDVHLQWQPVRQWSLSFDAVDLFSRIYWRDAPFTYATAKTDNFSVDEAGFIHFSPLISGVEGSRSFTQRIPGWFSLAVEHHPLSSKVSYFLNLRRYTTKTFHQIGVSYMFASSNELTLGVMPEQDAVTVAWRYFGFSLKLTANAIPVNEGTVFGVGVSYNLLH